MSDALRSAAAVARPAYAVLVLTSIHHVYGASIYQTPWRYHAVLLSAVAAALMAAGLALARSPGAVGQAGRALFWLVVVAIPIGMIGAFEGAYNHVFKNLMYFGGAPEATLARLFPPPTYELPNDLVFEVTGVLQVAPAWLAAQRLVRALRGRSAG